MKFMIPKLLLLPGAFSAMVLTLPGLMIETSVIPEEVVAPEIIETYDRNGIRHGTEAFENTYQRSDWKQNRIGALTTKKLDHAIRHQSSLFKFRSKKENYQVDNLNIERAAMMETVELLNSAVDNPELNPDDLFELHQIKGRDGEGSVHFTGYYTPVLKVSRTKKGAYQYPLYAFPKSLKDNLPSRAEIDGKGILKEAGLEIAYAANPVDVYFMQVQGSGFVEFLDGSQSLLSYAGNNKKSYRSIGRYLLSKGYTTKDKVSINSIKKFLRENPEKLEEVLFSNPSYVFFEEGKGAVKGTGVTPLTPGHSIAVDPKYIPLGSTLLAKVPIADNKGNFLHHEYRLLFAQDIGGAIKGAGHVDLYTGVGIGAKRLACNTHHYGELWLILPKSLNTRP